MCDYEGIKSITSLWGRCMFWGRSEGSLILLVSLNHVLLLIFEILSPDLRVDHFHLPRVYEIIFLLSVWNIKGNQICFILSDKMYDQSSYSLDSDKGHMCSQSPMTCFSVEYILFFEKCQNQNTLCLRRWDLFTFGKAGKFETLAFLTARLREGYHLTKQISVF